MILRAGCGLAAQFGITGAQTQEWLRAGQSWKGSLRGADVQEAVCCLDRYETLPPTEPMLHAKQKALSQWEKVSKPSCPQGH